MLTFLTAMSNFNTQGAVSVDGSGNITYTPPSPTFIGTDEFEYTFTDDGTAGGDSLMPGFRHHSCWSGIGVSSAGNIYVTGGSFGFGTRYDFATIKYSQEDTPAGKRVEVSNTGREVHQERGGNKAPGVPPVQLGHGCLSPGGVPSGSKVFSLWGWEGRRPALTRA